MMNSENFRPTASSTIMYWYFSTFSYSFTNHMSMNILYLRFLDFMWVLCSGTFFCFAFATVHASHGLIVPFEIVYPKTSAVLWLTLCSIAPITHMLFDIQHFLVGRHIVDLICLSLFVTTKIK